MRQKQVTQLLDIFQQLSAGKYSIGLVILITALLTSLLWWQGCKYLPTPSSTEECKVTKIYDGDTITLQCPGKTEATKVRMYCIDTPEMGQKPWGQQSRDYLRSITGEIASVEKIDTDRYGRTVGVVYSQGVNLNLAQVEAGQAAVYEEYCNLPEYKVAESKAKQANLGIWAQPGLQQTPWVWRKKK